MNEHFGGRMLFPANSLTATVHLQEIVRGHCSFVNAARCNQHSKRLARQDCTEIPAGAKNPSLLIKPSSDGCEFTRNCCHVHSRPRTKSSYSFKVHFKITIRGDIIQYHINCLLATHPSSHIGIDKWYSGRGMGSDAIVFVLISSGNQHRSIF